MTTEEGLLVEGFCAAAGIPSTEEAAEIIQGLSAGMCSYNVIDR